METPTPKRIVLVLLVLCLCLGCDQATKAAAKNYLAASLPISLVGGMVRLQYIQNPGAFLSFGADLSRSLRFWLFTTLVGVLLIWILLFIVFSGKMRPGVITAGSLIVGGGSSNLFDRLVNHGAVVDFMNIRVGNLSTGVFNLADVTITVGVGLLLFSSFHRRKVAQENESNRR